jgi:hypothetical protein
MSTFRFMRQHRVEPAILGLDTVVVANGAPVTSNTFSIEGHNQVSLHLFLDRQAATRVDVKLFTSPLRVGETIGNFWSQVMSNSIAAGVGTSTELELQNATGGDEYFEYKFGKLNAMSAKFEIEAVGGTTDTIKGYAILAYGPL